MIVPLDEVKAALGVTGNTEDAAITDMINHAAAFIEGETKRRFDEPIERTEYQYGNGSGTIFLAGHIDVAEADASEDDIVVYERLRGDSEWTLLDSTEYERRGDTLIRLFGWGLWSLAVELKLVYNDGYDEAPIDIRSVATELVIGEYNADASLADDSVGLTSETLVGVYSYTISSTAAVVASATGGGSVSDSARRALNRYRKQLV